MDDKKNDAPAEAGGEDNAALWGEINLEPTDNSAPDPDAPSDDEAADGDEAPAEAGSDATLPSDEAGDASDTDEVDPSTLPENVQKYLKTLEDRHKQEIHRHANRQRILEQKLRETQRPPAPEQEEPAGAETTDSFEEDFPDIAEALKKRIQPLQDLLDSMTAAEKQRTEDFLNANQEEFERKLPPKFFEEHGAAFSEWLNSEASVRDRKAFDENYEDMVDPAAALSVVQNFMRTRGAGSEPPGSPGTSQQLGRRQRQLASAASPQTRQRGAASGIPADADPQLIWDRTVV